MSSTASPAVAEAAFARADATVSTAPSATASRLDDGPIRRGTRRFRDTNLAMFAAGYATFSVIYCVQPLMPSFSAHFGVTPATSSLVLSATTGVLAFAMLIASAVSEIAGRKPMMVGSIVLSSLLAIATVFARDWHDLVLLRALIGLAISGLPAVAMAYLSEEMDRGAVGLAMGLYIGGSAVGGLGGRAVAGLVTELVSWQAGLFAVGAIGLACGLLLAKILPASRHFRRSQPSLAALAGSFRLHLADARQRGLFLIGFLLLGSFVCVYNYAGYRLIEPPYALGQGSVSLIYAVYLIGIFSSAWMGSLTSRYGRGPLLSIGLLLMLGGLLLTLVPSLIAIIAGMAVLTFGFFGAHSIASSWVGANAATAKAQASSLYLFSYYLGSGALGTLGGVFWSLDGWAGVATLIGALLFAGLVVATRLTRSPGAKAGAATPAA